MAKFKIGDKVKIQPVCRDQLSRHFSKARFVGNIVADYGDVFPVFPYKVAVLGDYHFFAEDELERI